jgi:hypothetical protein
MKLLPLPLTAVVLFGGFVAVSAQTLAGVAEQEEARRKAIDKPARVYTNADLKGANPLAAPATTTPPSAAPTDDKAGPAGKPEAAATPAATPPTRDTTPAGGDEAPAPSTPRDEAWWRARMVKLQEDTERTKTYIDALQSRINALTTDFVNRDDPYQRAVIESDRLKAIAELERLKTVLEQQNKAVVDLQEEARRASVPPGWLR